MELSLVQNGRIVLGAELKFEGFKPFGNYEDDEENEREEMKEHGSITTEAETVNWQNFGADEFSIPADYVKQAYNYDHLEIDSTKLADSKMLLDSLVRYYDTTVQA